jgi:hypothetical protein
MALVTVPTRDKKLIIWNFMEELWENHQNALENNLDTEFRFMDFYNIGLLSNFLAETGFDGFADKIVMDTLKEYANESGNVKIKGKKVKLTKKGLIECQKSEHEWD